jgi:hypothetical protein
MVGPGSSWWDNLVGPYSLYLNKGDPPSPNKFESSSEVVHSGAYCAKLSLLNPVDNRARRIHIEHNWDPIRDRHLFVESWYYLPPDFVVDDWTDLHRAVEERLGSNEGFQMTVTITKLSKVSEGEYRLRAPINLGWVDNDGNGINDLPRNYEVESKDSIRFGQWFKITTYIYRDLQHGIYKLWLNDALQWDMHDLRTIGILPERLASPPAGYTGSLASGISLYSGNWKQPDDKDWLGVHPKHAYYDDFTAWSPSEWSDDAIITANDTPTMMLAGHNYTVHITIRNVGLTMWTSAQHYELDVVGDSSLFGPAHVLPMEPKRRIPPGSPQTVHLYLQNTAPGEQYTFTFEITAPNSGGAYTLQYQMTREGTWFGQTTGITVTVS